MKKMILSFFFFIKLFSFSNENILVVEIISLGGKLYSRKSKIESSNYKLPFSKVIYNSNNEMIEISYKNEKNGSFKKIFSNKKYDYSKLKKLLENMYDGNFLDENMFIFCKECSILKSDITITTEAPVQPKENIVKIYKKILQEAETGNLFINGNQTHSMGLIYQIEYKDAVILLYEDSSYYKNKNTKELIDFINLSINNIPQRQYMEDYIKNID